MPNGRSWWRPTWVVRDVILDRRTWLYYLIVPDVVVAQLGDRFKVAPDERFYEVLNEHVTAYVEHGKMPPEEITSAVMNIADDILSDREVVLRSGDYIAVQNYARRM